MKTAKLSIDGKVYLSYVISDEIGHNEIVDKCALVLDRFALVKLTSMGEVEKTRRSVLWLAFVSAMALEHGVPDSKITAHDNHRPYPILRRYVCAAWKEVTGEPWKLIASRLGNRDHTTILQSKVWLVERFGIYPEYRTAYLRALEICSSIISQE